MKTLVRVLVSLAVVVLLALLVAHSLSLPATRGDIQLAGLEQPVAIRFDQRQRPYVQADSLEDALFAQGWLHASNRLWQMELFRRAGSGRLAAMLGSSMVESDIELWRIGVPQLARRLEAETDPAFRKLVARYVAGINAAIEQQQVPPPEFALLQQAVEAWRVEDVFAVGALTAYQSANNFRKELVRLALLEEVGEEAFAVFLEDGSGNGDFPLVLPREGDLLAALSRLATTDPLDNPLMPRLAFGSNGWVVSPQKSASGKALFAFDSHDALGLPNLFYEVHLFYGEGRQIRGWSAAGLPGVINGFNERIAWGFTNIGDTQDLFLEQPCGEPGHYLDGESCYPAEQETISLEVAGGKPVSFTAYRTRNGRLISEAPAIALRWTVQDIERLELDSLLALNQATSWEQFSAALDRFPAPTLNATYADVGGNIGFRTAGVIPQRGRGKGLYPLDGSAADNRWQGLVPASQMPQRSNPAQGYLAAANARVNAAGDGPLVSADNASPYRIKRIQDVLASQDSLTLDDMQTLQMDWYDSQAGLLLRDMLAQVDRAALSDAARRSAGLLSEWASEPIASPDSAAALIFQRWYPALARQIFGTRIDGPLLEKLLKESYVVDHALDTLLAQRDDPVWWQGRKGEHLASSLNAAVAALQEETGEDDPSAWYLAGLQRVGLSHELSSALPGLGALLDYPEQAWGGGSSTVGRARSRYDRPNRIRSGATVRVVAEMSTPITARAIIPGGQSGYPFSPHYFDQFPDWLAGSLDSLAAEPDEVGGDTLMLRPETAQ